MGETQGNNLPKGKGMGIAAIIMGAITCNAVALGLGIAGVVMDGQANTKLTSGDQAGAQSTAKTAKTLSLVGLIFGIVGIVVSIIYVILMAAGVVAGGMSGMFQ